ncbi:glycosyltransferase family 87 protein [Burkholderia stagnalis]|uniref:glycosyltransferase family 87 protein n=1 Tax=Burkholderia stagnalis TaxID=1503054 RepID=UPI0009BCABDA|nr:glycosyltransferase family 87 protein [Burkholderia stagnalis]
MMQIRHPERHALPAFDAHPELPAAGPRRRPHWLSLRRVRTYAQVALYCYLLFVAIYVVRLFGPHGDTLPAPVADFAPTWSAAWLAAHGQALDAWRVAALHAVEVHAIASLHGAPAGLPWRYPPATLLLATPLGWLPYAVAAIVWLGGACALFAVAIRLIVQRRSAALCAWAFPGMFIVTVTGQDGLLTASLAGFGLLLLQRRPIAAGVCFGMLGMKPQLAVLFPLALLCAAQWRALAAWAATVAGLAALATLAFGADAWSAFAQAIDAAHRTAGALPALLVRTPTAQALAALAGWPPIVALSLQGLAIACAVAAVCYAWRGSCTYALRAATLICATLLAAPSLIDGDLAWYGILIAWYARHAFAFGWRRFDREWLALLWAAPLAGLAVAHLHVQFMPLVAAVSLLLLVMRIAHERHDAPCMPDAHDSATDTDFTHAVRPRHAPPRLHRFDRQPLPFGIRH